MFEDNPEKFRTWCAAFQNMIRVLLASNEQLNLIDQHMADGSESKTLVEHLNQVYISNPDVGLDQVEKGLQERFGNDEAVLQSLLYKLELLPQVSPHDCKTLQMFSDTIEEREAAKKRWFSSGTCSFGYISVPQINHSKASI